MSIRIMSQVWDLETESSTEKLVLLALADNANDSGYCWPSLHRIIKKCQLSERCVRDTLRILEGKGWLKTDHSPGHSSTYELKIPTPAPGAPPETPAPDAPPPRHVAPLPRHDVPDTPAPGAPITIIEPSLNHNVRVCASKFKKPTIEEIKLLGAKIGLCEEACCHFYDHYESNGWKVGRNPMRSVPHAMANWKRNQQTYGPNKTQSPRINQRNVGTYETTTDIASAVAKRSISSQMAAATNGAQSPPG